MSRHQTAEQNRKIKPANKFFENVAEFKCLGTTETNENWINEGPRTHKIWGIFVTFIPLLSFHLLSKNLYIKIYFTCCFFLM
jgi:hypothetical protein